MRLKIIAMFFMITKTAFAGEFYDGPPISAACWKDFDCLIAKGGMALARTRSTLPITYSLAQGLAAHCPGVRVNEDYFRRWQKEVAMDDREKAKVLKEIGPATVRQSACKKLRKGIIQDELQKECDAMGGGSGCPSVDGSTLKELPIVITR